ncbi:roadblock/LC7 domain-containing protein [Tenacibaculum amylolyticum]|uniref:roadblock/LC7 domain-containing protein n=1 Tax=Tenacibaculum amylolyticum TaxID=104269 RepID=UPI00389334B3
MGKINTSEFLKLTKADGVIILNEKGELLEEAGISNKDNIGAMLAVIHQMVNDFTQEANIGGLHQLVVKAEKGLFMFGKMDDIIIGIHSQDISKTGLITASMNKLINST